MFQVYCISFRSGSVNYLPVNVSFRTYCWTFGGRIPLFYNILLLETGLYLWLKGVAEVDFSSTDLGELQIKLQTTCLFYLNVKKTDAKAYVCYYTIIFFHFLFIIDNMLFYFDN